MNTEFFMGGDSFGTRFGTDYLVFFSLTTFHLCWMFLALGGIFWKKTGMLLSIIVVILLTHFLLPAQSHLIDIRHIYLAIPIVLIIGAIGITELFENRLKLSYRKFA